MSETPMMIYLINIIKTNIITDDECNQKTANISLFVYI